jgi:predicted esterase
MTGLSLRKTGTKFLFRLGIPAVVAAMALSVGVPKAATPVLPPPADGAPATAAPTIETDWCIEGFRGLDEGCCFVLPDAPARTLLIYFHGIVPPGAESVQKTHVESVVAKAARRAGVAALLPRGKKGLAPKGRDGWYGWPTTEASYREHAPALLALLKDRQDKLAQRNGVPFTRVYVAGSSSGAYFATQVAIHGGIAAHGFGAMSGGAAVSTEGLDRIAPRPFYVGFGKYDPSSREGAAGLGAMLRRLGWPVRIAEHPVDHGAREIYLDEAFAFWREQEPAATAP